MNRVVPALKATVRHRVIPWLRPRGALPNLLIIGAMKAGTTALHNNLAQHPQGVSSKNKEVHYFDLHYSSSERWYRSRHPRRLPSEVGFESSPYYLYHPCVPGRAAVLLPNVKLIVLLRNPVRRAFSHYWHERRSNRENLSFTDAVAAEPARLLNQTAGLLAGEFKRSESHQRHSYVDRGRYADQIRRWLGHFERSQFLFLESEESLAMPIQTLHTVTDFLEIDRFEGYELAKGNKGGYREAMPLAVEAELGRTFADANRDLAELCGRSFSWGP